MEIYIYETFNDWYKDKATEVLEGEIRPLYNGLIAIDTLIDGKNYRQLISSSKNYAVIYKMECSYFIDTDEINIYKDRISWQKSKPDIVFEGKVCEDECTDTRFVFMSKDGFKHYLSFSGIYAVTYGGNKIEIK